MKFIFLVLLVLSGCSRGFHREELRAGLEGPVINDQAVAEEFRKSAQLPKPFRLGVYFKEIQGGTRWKVEEKEIFHSVALPPGEVSAVFPISEELVPTQDFRSVRLAAARQGADAVLVVSGVEELKQSPNGWAATYLLVLPMLFARGIDQESLFIARALLWDVKNSFLYLGAEAESEKVISRPLAFPAREEQKKSTRREALEKLKIELESQIGFVAKS